MIDALRTRAIALGDHPWLQRARDTFPLTPLGATLLIMAYAASSVFGTGRIDLFLLALGDTFLVVMVLVGLAVGVGVAVLWRKTRDLSSGSSALEIESGYGVRTGFTLPAMRWLPFVNISWSWVYPEATVTPVREGPRVIEVIHATRRGVGQRIERRFVIRDPFGLYEVAFRREEQRAYRVIPATGALKRMQVIQGLSGGHDLSHPDGTATGDPIDMRPYAPGDPIRMVLWKVFARTRDLVVRTPERAISPVQQTIAYLVTGTGDEPSAGAARVAIESGALGGDWLLGADGADEPATVMHRALDVLARSSATTEAGSGVGLGDFLARVTHGTQTRAIVFVPPLPGSWLKRTVAAASSAPCRVDFVICVDGIDRHASEATGWRRWMAPTDVDLKVGKVPGTGRPVRQSDIARVVEALRGVRAGITIVDRTSGRVFSASQILGGGRS